ncbi:hypothetical protein TNCV_1524241 [Trichonephila clavipes]|nr:hypothetical protein TNCV_1524241 [Trichonephila clavipes]
MAHGTSGLPTWQFILNVGTVAIVHESPVGPVPFVPHGSVPVSGPGIGNHRCRGINRLYQCRFKLISGPGPRISTGPLGSDESKGQLFDPVKSSLSGPFRFPGAWTPIPSTYWIDLHWIVPHIQRERLISTIEEENIHREVKISAFTKRLYEDNFRKNKIEQLENVLTKRHIYND